MRLNRVWPVLMVAAVTLWCVLPVYSAGQTGDPLWQYVHPQAQFLAGLDLAKARVSPGGKTILKQVMQSGKPAMVQAGMGTEILDRIDRVLISAPAPPAGGTKGADRIVVAIEGRIDREVLKKMMPAGTVVERFLGADLFVPPKSKKSDMVMAVIGDRIAVLGDRPSLELVLPGTARLEDQGLLERAAHLAPDCEFWLTAAAPPSALTGGDNPSQFDDMKSIDLGVSLQKGMSLQASLGMNSVESAQGITMMAGMFATMASRSATTRQQASDIASLTKNLKVAMEGKTVRIGIDIPQAQLERTLTQVQAQAQQMGQKAMAGLLTGSASAGTPQKGAASTPVVAASAAVQPQEQPVAPPPQKRTIRIVGAEGGDKEVVYKSGGSSN